LFVSNGTKIDTNATLKALISLTIKPGNVYKTDGLEVLALYDPLLFYDIIVKNAHIISLEDWEMLAKSLRIDNFTEKDTIILNAIIAALTKCNPEDVHYSIVSFLSERGDFKIAKTFSILLNKNFSNECKHSFLDCMVKFKDKELDSIVKTYFVINAYNDIIVPGILFDMDAYERYDFLPELKALRSNLKNGKIKTKEKTLLNDLDNYIANLEKKKEISATIGLPLDWPNGATK
jgi:hypothetical protein